MPVPMGWTALSDIWAAMVCALTAECGEDHETERDELLRLGVTQAMRWYPSHDSSGLIAALIDAQAELAKQLEDSISRKRLCVHKDGALFSLTLREWNARGNVHWPEGVLQNQGLGALVIEDGEAKRLLQKVTAPQWLRPHLVHAWVTRADWLEERAADNRNPPDYGPTGHQSTANPQLAEQHEAEAWALREKAAQPDIAQDQGGRPPHPARAWYAEQNFQRNGMTMKELQRAMPKDEKGEPPAPSTIRDWEKKHRKAD